MNKKYFILISCLTMLVFSIACENAKEEKVNHIKTKIASDTLINFSVRPAPQWTNRFYRSKGWFGADGVFSMNLNGSERIGFHKKDSIFMYFSDTMTGKILRDTVENFEMINNSIALVSRIYPYDELVKIKMNTDDSGNPINYFNPNTKNSTSAEYYWFGDGFVNQEDHNSINIFGYRVIDHSEKSWDFEITGVTILTVPSGSKEPFDNHTQIDAPLFMNIDGLGKGTFGSGIYVNTKKAGAPNPDGFLYIYGLLDPNKQLVVARVKPSLFKQFENWSFWDGESWTSDMNQVKPITNRVSNEVSLTPLKDGRYLLVFQEDGIGNHTAIRIAESPTGPFGPIQRIWKAPEVNEPPGIIPYNAKAHPVLSTKDELLISYNTISVDYFNDILNYPHMYRPRFFWLKIND